MSPGPSKTFVVRIWLEPYAGHAPLWRASLTDTDTHEKQYFSSPEALAAYLVLQELGEAQNDAEGS